MSDETPGAGQGALPPREGQGPARTSAERPTMRLTQVGPQYVIHTQHHGVPALAQVKQCLCHFCFFNRNVCMGFDLLFTSGLPLLRECAGLKDFIWSDVLIENSVWKCVNVRSY